MLWFNVQRSFEFSQDNESFECLKCPLEKVILSFFWHRASIKIGMILALSILSSLQLNSSSGNIPTIIWFFLALKI